MKLVSIAFAALALVFLPPAPVAQEEIICFKLRGQMFDYQWANSSNRMAVLYVDENWKNSFIHILTIDSKQCLEKIEIPGDYRPACLAWLRDDSGFLLGFDMGYQEYGFFVYSISNGTFERAYENLETLYHGIHDIVLDKDSQYWAVTYVGEGHPDVAVYEGTNLLFYTDVYPDSITTLAWLDRRLYCLSGSPLESGLTRDQRKENSETESPDDEPAKCDKVYSIDPASQKATAASVTPEELLVTSFDKKYSALITDLDNAFEIKIEKEPDAEITTDQ